MNNTSTVTPATVTIPSKLELTCTITGKKVTWTNKSIIAKKIAEFGTLEAFIAQFTCRGAKNKATIAATITQPKVMEDIMKKGVELGALTPEDYARIHPQAEVPSPGTDTATEMATSIHPYNDGSTCTVVEPKQAGTDAANAKGRAKIKAPKGKVNTE